MTKLHYVFLCDNKEIPLEKIFTIKDRRKHNIKIIFNNKKYSCICGNDAIYFQINSTMGIKIFTIRDKYYKSNLYNLLQFKKLNIPCFPTIFNIKIYNNHIILYLEHVPRTIPTSQNIEECITNINNFMLQPENNWSSSINLFGSKIIDFHRFSIMPKLYKFPTNNKSWEELNQIYITTLQKFKTAKINQPYEGMKFDNGYIISGKSSNGIMFDSYRKLPFCYLKNAQSVLDIGCNSGFFSNQAILQGAQQVIGIDKNPEYIEFAKKIQSYLELSNITYMCDNIENFLKHNNKRFSTILLLSVIHQVFPNLKNANNFFEHIKQIGKNIIIELPINHPKMQLSETEILKIIKPFFKKCYLVHMYDAYSHGKRAIFTAHSNIDI